LCQQTPCCHPLLLLLLLPWLLPPQPSLLPPQPSLLPPQPSLLPLR
jgi:hypothetical protein